MPRAPHYRKTGHPSRLTTKTPPLIQLTIFVPMLDISDILSSPPAFSIKAHLSPCLPPIRSSFFPPETLNQEPQPLSRSLYSALEIANALLLAAALDVEESDKNNIGVVGIKDGSIKLDAQIKLKRHLTFLADNLLSDDGIDKETK